jgi:hypothetical protein
MMCSTPIEIAQQQLIDGRHAKKKSDARLPLLGGRYPFKSIKG